MVYNKHLLICIAGANHSGTLYNAAIAQLHKPCVSMICH